ncbi:hypothetical protein Csa_003375 [Cucumis sativus]|nr:hypothetical protein Csa_003375 [Cucumis sativus]
MTRTTRDQCHIFSYEELKKLPSGHHVDPKTKIVFSLYAPGRMSDVWGRRFCMESKLERWINSENEKIKHSKLA